MSAPHARRAAHRLPPLTPLLCLLLASFLPAARAATFTVTSLADDGTPGTLRAAINGAQASTDVSDTITVTAQGTIALTGGELLLSNPNNVAGKTVTLTGPGAGALFVSGNRLSGSTTFLTRVFHFSNVSVAMSNLAVIQGNVNSGSFGGGGILQEGGTLTLDHCVVEDCATGISGALGGGIADNGGALTLTHCVVTANGDSVINQPGGAGGIGAQNGTLTLTDCTLDDNEGILGGGIYSTGGSLMLTRCAVTANTALDNAYYPAYGGGVYSSGGTATLTDCRIQGNQATNAGCGVYLASGTATIQGCTFSGNAPAGGLISPTYELPGGGLNIAGATAGVANCTFISNTGYFGAGIYNQGTLTLSDSTLFSNSGQQGAALYTAPGSSSSVTSTILAGSASGTNVSGAVTSGGSNLLGDPDGNGFANGVNHDQTGLTPFASGVSSALADNGGPTPTLALRATSPAIDADFADATPTDQRGATRPVGARNDIGAFEYGATATPNTPDTFTVSNTNDDGDGSLRRAVNNADADPGTRIVFDPSVFGTPRTITLTSGPLAIRQDMTVAGPGQGLLAVSGNNTGRVLNISGSGTENISDLTVTGGNVGSAYGTTGGGIFASGGPLNLTDCTISNCTAGGQNSAGGGLEDYTQSPVTLTRCTITNCSAPNGSGGGLNNFIGTLTLTDCTISGCSAAQGGGFYAAGTNFVSDCTFSGNTATAGGGVYCNGFLLMSSCTLSANTAGTGAGLDSASSALVASTIIAGNTGGANVSGTATTLGSNLVGDPDGSGFTGGTSNDQTGVSDPKLGPLQNNGGPTPTMALLSGSPAIDADFYDTGGTDQRGVTRPIGNRDDIGAYEYGGVAAGNDAYSVTPDTTLTVAAPGVLGNDDADGAALTATVQTPPAHGTLTLSPNGSFTYTPTTGFLGVDTFTYQAAEAGGVTGTATVTLTVSALSPPTTTATLAGTQGNNGYYTGPVTVTLTATDPSSGAGGAITTTYTVDGGTSQAYSGPFTVSGDGPHTITFSSAGAQSGPGPSGSVAFQIDATPPTLTFGTPTPAANASGYANAPMSIPYTASDATSGVASAAPGSPVTFTAEGAHQTQVVTVTDNAGNSATFTTPPVSLDLTPPVTTAASQSTTTGQQVTLTATDALSGVASTVYAVDGGAQTPYAGPFTVRGNGPHTVTFASTDNAGNAEATETLTFTVNIAAPVTTATLSGPQGTNGWYTDPVTVTLSATSQASTITGTFYTIDGGAQMPYTGPFTVSGDARHAVTYFSTDAAGNTEAANRQPVLIDATPPVTTAAVAGTENSAGAYIGTATVTLTATDALSGVAATAYVVDGGASRSYAGAFTVTAAGSHTVTFHSTDKAGNAEAAQTVTLTVTPVTPPILHTFPAGLQMFAVTESYAAGTALTPAPGRLAVWDPTLLQYTLSGGDSALAPGQGYWARFAQSTDLSASGTPTPTGAPFTLSLKKGWNMIGDPFPAPVSLANAQVIASGKTYAGLSDASKAGVTAFTLYGYPAGSTRYQIQSGDAPMQPYQGYWLYAFTDCTLAVSAP